MTSLADQIRALAAEVEALSSEGGSCAPLTWPPGANLIGGTEPSAPTLVAGDVDSGAVNQTYYDRLCGNSPDGVIPFFGDSLIQSMPVSLASPFAINLGYGGASTRRLIHHMKRAAYKGVLQRAGAGVILTGANDVGNVGYYGTRAAAAATVVNPMLNTMIKNWITGPWVIVKPLPGDGRVSGFPADYNAAMDIIGDGIDTAFSSVSNVRIVDAWSALIDGSGNLATANHIGDGQHLSKAGYAILCPLIASALADLGVQ